MDSAVFISKTLFLHHLAGKSVNVISENAPLNHEDQSESEVKGIARTNQPDLADDDYNSIQQYFPGASNVYSNMQWQSSGFQSKQRLQTQD